jgi:hypothetical protein
MLRFKLHYHERSSMEVITKILAESNKKFGIIVTGGGSGIFPKLLNAGGGSKFLLFGEIPYATEAISALLGYSPKQFTSEETARALAVKAYRRTLEYTEQSGSTVGIACTASLQKIPDEREGRMHKVICVVQTNHKTIQLSWCNYLEPGQTPAEVRKFEEDLTEQTISAALLIGSGINYSIDGVQIRESHILDTCYDLADPCSAKLVEITRDGIVDADSSRIDYILPGSFNPIHAAHYEILDSYKNSVFEISMINADKSAIDALTLEERLLRMRPGTKVLISNAKTFVEKSKLFPHTTFLVGYDTALRIINPKYAGSVESIEKIFTDYATNFIVFGRTIDGEYQHSISSFPIEIRHLFTEHSEVLKNSELSSTKLRQAAGIKNE